MKAEILVDSGNFMRKLEQEVIKAKESVYIQAMSFEGDEAGKSLIDILLKSNAKDIRLCVDSYSKLVINDQFIYSLRYLRSAKFRETVRNTKQFIEDAKSKGIKIKYTNPLGFLFLKYPRRNHKKMVVIDGKQMFIGGINFSNHNFIWHDFMLLLGSPKLSEYLHHDFLQTWEGKNQSLELKEGNSSLFLLDGYRSKYVYDDLFEHISSAKKSIHILSPYVSNPLLSFIKKEVDRSVDVKIISPAENNKSIFKHFLVRELKHDYFKLLEYQKGMSHLKAILIDDEKLIIGSSNFDFVSYYYEQEIVLVTTEQEIVKEFVDKIYQPDIFHSVETNADSSEGSLYFYFILRFAENALAAIAKKVFRLPNK